MRLYSQDDKKELEDRIKRLDTLLNMINKDDLKPKSIEIDEEEDENVNPIRLIIILLVLGSIIYIILRILLTKGKKNK